MNAIHAGLAWLCLGPGSWRIRLSISIPFQDARFQASFKFVYLFSSDMWKTLLNLLFSLHHCMGEHHAIPCFFSQYRVPIMIDTQILIPCTNQLYLVPTFFVGGTSEKLKLQQIAIENQYWSLRGLIEGFNNHVLA